MRYIINVEKIYDDDVWNNLTRFLKKKGKRCHLFLIAPQINFLKANLGYRGEKSELTKKMIHRYRMLAKAQIKYKFQVGIRVYLSLQPHLLTEQEKHQSLKFVHQWFNRIFNKKISYINFGWDAYDAYTQKLCTTNKIHIINDKWGSIRFHDYDLPLNNKVIGKWLKTATRKLKGQGPRN